MKMNESAIMNAMTFSVITIIGFGFVQALAPLMV